MEVWRNVGHRWLMAEKLKRQQSSDGNDGNIGKQHQQWRLCNTGKTVQ